GGDRARGRGGRGFNEGARGGGDHELVSADAEWFGHALEDPVGDHRRVAPVTEVFEEHHELVTAEAGDGVPRPEERFEPLCESREQLIADRMAEAVVDDLEAID